MEFNIIGLEQDSETEDIMECLHNLYSTPAGSIPGDRDFGLSWASVDMVPSELEPTYSLEIMEKTDRYEPRVKVMEITFDWTGEQTLVTVQLERMGDGENGR